ncbi:MAG: VWA domain-containing protein [Dehalococcoidia bacterium]|nr:VWA domain-containing protein [Dehalococcoidia bacterium]
MTPGLPFGLVFAPVWLLVAPLALAALLLGVRSWRRSGDERPTVWVGDGAPASAASRRRTVRMRMRWLPGALHGLAVLLLLLALARPRQGLAVSVIPEDGIDLVIALDTSSSMTERIVGTTESKLDAAKRVVRDFASELDGDRVGLVIFQARALTMSPLTVDEQAISRSMEQLRSGFLPDGTAIGLGLAESLNLLRESPAKSRVVVLLTDGQHNSGEIEPSNAIALAKALGVRVYTIGFGAGRPGSVDANMLTQMAEVTDGHYFDAATAEDLTEAYTEIGRLERSAVGERRYTRYRELAPALALAALGTLAIEGVLRSTWLRRHP